MPKQTVIWTALPNGAADRDGNHFLRLSVFVSPRLQSTSAEGNTLDLFPDFRHWTDTVKRITFSVEFENGPTLAASVVEQTLESELWEALFNDETFIQPYQFDDYSNRLIISYSSRRVLAFLKQIYQSTSFWSGDRLPDSRALARELSQIVIPWNGDYARSVRDWLISEQQAGTPPATSPVKNFERLLLFHYPPVTTPVKLPQTEADFSRYIDFHQAVSSLGNYPELMRRIGLVIDLELPSNEIPPIPPGQLVGSLRVVPNWTPDERITNVDLSPNTAFIWDGVRFAAAPRSTIAPGGQGINTGLLTLDPDEYDLIQVDVDGAAIKAINFAMGLGFSRQRGAADTPSQAGLPALRSGGISVIRDNRAAQVSDTFGSALSLNSMLEENMPVLLFSEDLVRGLRVDVWDALSNRWHSLCKRIGTYSFTGAGITRTFEDEGIVRMGVTQAAAAPGTSPPTPADLYLHESLFRWEGWSLCATRPGKSINRSPDPSAQPERPDNTPVTPFKLAVSFAATPHSLPRLRFGLNYRLRARVVDLAGNSISLEEASDNLALPESPTSFEYLRYEPVNAPAAVLRKPLAPDTTPGESLERLVIRSLNTDISKDSQPAVETSERHIAPPRTSQLMSEVHGMLDAPSGGLKTDTTTYTLIKTKDEGKFAIDPATNTPVQPEEQLKLPYLPDPLAHGAALRDLPFTPDGTVGQVDGSGNLVFQHLPGVEVRPGSAVQINFGLTSAWPDVLPFRLVLAEGATQPVWDEDKRVLTIHLPKAEVASVPLSSFLVKDDLKLMGIWQWLREYVDGLTQAALFNPAELEAIGKQIAQLTQRALEGGHWMLTPSRQFTLVHAVQQPLGQPAFKALEANRDLGNTFANLFGLIKVHGKSTMKLDLLAEWQEPIDPVEEAGPRILSGHAHAAEVQLNDLSGGILFTSGMPVGTYQPKTDSILFEDAHPRHEFGDTKHRQVRYRAAATSRFREYFPSDAAGGFIRTSDELVVDVPSSARPAAPNVRYVLPTFGWERQTSTNMIASERLGGGLRIYLERPWFSSGEGELLGVVLWPDTTPLSDEQREQLKPFITQWGMDPIWGSPPTSNLPQIANFTQAVASDTGLSLGELIGGTVAVAGHTVNYDADRHLWYCDIELDAGSSYYPFIRLALARYQPHSILNAQLSRVVLADFTQIAPDRSVIITYDPYNSDMLNVVVSGLTYNSTADLFSEPELAGSFVVVNVEMRRPDIGGDLGWGPATNARVFVNQEEASGTMLWQGRIVLPSGRAPGQFRLVIKEYESLLADSQGTGLFGGLVREGLHLPRKAQRMVFADTIEL